MFFRCVTAADVFVSGPQVERITRRSLKALLSPILYSARTLYSATAPRKHPLKATTGEASVGDYSKRIAASKST